MSNDTKKTGNEDQYYEKSLQNAINGESKPSPFIEIFIPPSKTEEDARDQGFRDGTFIRELKKGN